MKFIFTTILIFLTSLSFSQTIEVESKLDDANVEARIVNGKIYFKLKCLNEVESSTYILTRKDKDGNEEFIGSKQGVKNSINQIISYSFKDENPGNKSAHYYLIRITDSGKILSTWKYSGNQSMVAARE